jgi:probable phosphoglycerate mutase
VSAARGPEERVTTRLLLVRHGESLATINEVVGGRLGCTGLSELGRQQSARLRDRLDAGHEPKVDVVYASPLRRAAETAEIAAAGLGLDIVYDDDLEEHRPGEADGVTWSDVELRFGVYIPERHPHARMAPGAETLAEFHHRVNSTIHRLVEAHAGQTVLVVCHGGVIDMVFRAMLGVSHRPQYDLWTTNAAITEFEATHPAAELPHRWRLRRYNDAAHLAGLPLHSVPA